MKYLLWSLAHYKIGLSIFFLLSFKSLYNVDDSPWSDMSFVNIYPHTLEKLSEYF